MAKGIAHIQGVSVAETKFVPKDLSAIQLVDQQYAVVRTMSSVPEFVRAILHFCNGCNTASYHFYLTDTFVGCPAGTRCASRRGYCQRRERPTTVSTSTSAPTSQCTSGAIKRGINDHPEIQERQNLRPDCSYECRNGKWMPLITIENIAGKTDQLFVSMCSGRSSFYLN